MHEGIERCTKGLNDSGWDSRQASKRAETGPEALQFSLQPSLTTFEREVHPVIRSAAFQAAGRAASCRPTVLAARCHRASRQHAGAPLRASSAPALLLVQGERIVIYACWQPYGSFPPTEFEATAERPGR